VSIDFGGFNRSQPPRGDDDIPSFMRSVDIFEVWRLLGLPGNPQPGRACCCPFHAEKNPSFSIYRSSSDGRWMWKCHSQCDDHGDVLDLVVKATGLCKGDALSWLRKSFRGPVYAPSLRPQQPRMPSEPPEPSERPKPSLNLDVGTEDEIRELAALRGFQVRGLNLASDRGLLRFADHMDERCWVTTDSDRVAMACRPLAARTWANGFQSKVKNAPNSINNHLQGGCDVDKYNVQFVTEGGPDLLAAHDMILQLDDYGVVSTKYVGASGFLSANSALSSLVAERFRDLKVVIFAHGDEIGISNAEGWASQIRPYAEYVYVIPANSILPGCKDLLDLMNDRDGRLDMSACLSRLFRDGIPPRI
jgi:hypothetical protein